MNIAVLLSGGVDSSLALQLLKEEGGHNLTAYYLKVWLEDEWNFLGACPWEEDMEYARAVCEKLDIPLEIISLQEEYRHRIMTYTVAELANGRTPSPDILCNQRIKFGVFLERIEAKADKIASGHYARVEKKGERYVLKRSPDRIKDQTYFLCSLSQEQLARSLFPIGHLRKEQVREMARRSDLPTQHRKDSQGVCFLGKIKYPEFVRDRLGEKRGEIADVETGQILGMHKGVWFFTIGQRKGLDLGGGPWYVVEKDVKTNRVYVVHGNHIQPWAASRFIAESIHWIGDPPQKENLHVKIRHGPELKPCRIWKKGKNALEVTLSKPDTGVAPGQWAVFYDGEDCLGSAVISLAPSLEARAHGTTRLSLGETQDRRPSTQKKTS